MVQHNSQDIREDEQVYLKTKQITFRFFAFYHYLFVVLGLQTRFLNFLFKILRLYRQIFLFAYRFSWSEKLLLTWIQISLINQSRIISSESHSNSIVKSATLLTQCTAQNFAVLLTITVQNQNRHYSLRVQIMLIKMPTRYAVNIPLHEEEKIVRMFVPCRLAYYDESELFGTMI